MSPLIGTPYWITFDIKKSKPLAATSVEIKMLKVGELLNFYNFVNLCFCCICEWSETVLYPKDSMKNCILFEAFIVLANIITFDDFDISAK